MVIDADRQAVVLNMAQVMKIMAILYHSGQKVEYLLMRRPPARGDYWTAITGHVEKDEKLLDALSREVMEETGIGEVSYIIDLRVPFRYTKGGDDIEEHSFGVQVDTKEVRLSDEHTTFEWLEYEAALERLKWDQQKNSLQVLNDMINL